MAIVNKCAFCGARIVLGVKDGENHYCSKYCLENHRYPSFCKDCVSETTDESTGGTSSINGIGTTLYGNASRCPHCHSVIKRKWFCILCIPVVPLKRYRVKAVSAANHISRRLPDENLQASQFRVVEQTRLL